jgi:hypothetical protein
VWHAEPTRTARKFFSLAASAKKEVDQRWKVDSNIFPAGFAFPSRGFGFEVAWERSWLELATRPSPSITGGCQNKLEGVFTISTCLVVRTSNLFSREKAVAQPVF